LFVQHPVALELSEVLGTLGSAVLVQFIHVVALEVVFKGVDIGDAVVF
jgi:hypothetical protein